VNELEEIKNRIDIVDYVGKYVTLKQAGRNFKGVCPFHTEKTPSFTVSPERQMWRCFGACNEGGDIFAFAQKIEGLSFPEAVTMLAEKAGVKIERHSFEKSESKTRAYGANEMAQDFFHELLLSERGKNAHKYLSDRNITDQTIKEFKIGLAPSGKSELIAELKKHNFSESELVAWGLAAKKQGELKDFFWNRIIFPIHDVSGRVLGFSGRVLDDSLPKYINTPETEVYIKSNVLYGLNQAKEQIRKNDNGIIVEGMMDVIASSQVGIKNVVAPGGTALTENQLRLIGRFTKNLKLAFDIDFAGSQATRRAIEIAWREGFDIKVITIPSGKDAADAVKEDPKIWKEAVKNSVYVVDYLFDSAFNKFSPKESLGKKHIAKELLPVIKRLPEEIERDTYIKKLAEGLGVSEQSVRETLQKVGSPREEKTVKKQEAPKSSLLSKTKDLEKNIIGLLILYPHNLEIAIGILEENDFMEAELGACYQKIISYYQKNGDFSEKKFLKSLAADAKDQFNLFIMSAQHEFEDLDEEKKNEEVYSGIKRLKKISLETKKRAISAEIAAYEKEGDLEGTKKALERLQELIKSEQAVS
jgi:DNA primase